MTSHALRFLVVVVKIAPSVARSPELVSKNQQKRHVGQLKVFYKVDKVMCSIATQIQRNLAWSCLFFFSINEELRSVVKEQFNGKLFSQILDTECVAGKCVLTMCQYNFPHEKKNRRGGGSI